MRLAFARVAAVLLLVAACGDDRATPRAAFEALRDAVIAHDGHAFDALVDANDVQFRRAFIRERRAMLERGDDPMKALEGVPLSAEEIKRGTEDDAASLVVERRSPLFQQSTWLASATIVDEQSDGPDAACVRIAGTDGVKREFWFVREGGRWCYDQFRTRSGW